MVVPYTLDEAVVSKNLEPFIPKCNIAEFTSMLKRTKAIITKHFALSLVLAVESTSENKESFVTSGPPQLHLEIPSRSRITFKRWMNEMQADETKHSCQKGESTYKFKGPNEMQEFDCRFEDQDSRSIRSHLSMEASAFQCYFEMSSMSLFVRFYEQTRKGLFKFVKWMKESDHQKDKIKQKTEILTSLGLTDVGEFPSNVEFDFTSPTTFQKIPGLNETQTKQAVEDRLNTRLQNFIGADKESSPNGPLDIATFRRFCESTYNEITEEIDIINSKKRRNHEIMTSARKISVLDDKVDEVYTQQITGILDTSSSKQASLNIDEETCSRQLAYLRDLCGETQAPRLAKCGICDERYVDTAIGMCGHVFCEDCAHSFMCDEDECDGEGSRCPYCQNVGFIETLYGLRDD